MIHQQLEHNIEIIQKQIAKLLLEESIQNAQQQALNRQLQKIIQQINHQQHQYNHQNQQQILKIKQQYQQNNYFLDSKITNHQNTLNRYKNLHQKIVQQSTSHEYNQTQRLNKKSIKLTNKQRKKPSQLNLNMIASSISIPCAQDQSISVITQLQCQNCNKLFKPYRYHQHIQLCTQKLVNENQYEFTEQNGSMQFLHAQ